MNLPFLKNKNMRAPGVAVEVRKPDAPDSEKDESNAGLMACAEDLMKAVQANDAKGVASAFQAAFEICESYPHEEAEAIESEEE